MAYQSTPLLGVDLGNAQANGGASSTAIYQVGVEVVGIDNGVWRYVYAGSAIAAYDCVHIANSGTANPITPALAAEAGLIGFAQTALTSGYYGWVQRSGTNFRLNVLANCASGVPLYTSDTAGSLDDLTKSTSHYQVQGVLVIATNSGSASNVPAVAAAPPIIKRPQA